jgi:hypothetical protein
MSQKVANRLPIMRAVLIIPEGPFSQVMNPPLPGPTLLKEFVEFRDCVKGHAMRFNIGVPT